MPFNAKTLIAFISLAAVASAAPLEERQLISIDGGGVTLGPIVVGNPLPSIPVGCPAFPSVSVPPVPTVSVPPVPSVSLPPIPSISLPPLPSISLPPIPSISLPPIPSISLPPIPSISLPPIPSISLPPIPSISLPPLPSISLPPLPSISLPPLPSISLPPLPSISLPPLPSISLPPLPSISLPPLPSISLPPLPSISIPTIPGISLPPIPMPSGVPGVPQTPNVFTNLIGTLNFLVPQILSTPDNIGGIIRLVSLYTQLNTAITVTTGQIRILGAINADRLLTGADGITQLTVNQLAISLAMILGTVFNAIEAAFDGAASTAAGVQTIIGTTSVYLIALVNQLFRLVPGLREAAIPLIRAEIDPITVSITVRSILQSIGVAI